MKRKSGSLRSKSMLESAYGKAIRHRRAGPESHSPQSQLPEDDEGDEQEKTENENVSREVIHAAASAAEENANELESNLRSRQMQKRNMQKEIMQRGREAKTQGTAGAAKGLGERLQAAKGKFGEAIADFVKDNSMATLLGMGGVLLLLGVLSSFGSCGMMMSGGGGAVAYTSFTAKDNDIKAVEKEYQSLEKDLKKEMDKINKTHAGYDEYDKSIATIAHDPFELAALLTVLYEDYTKKGVKDYLPVILDGQYDFSSYATVETRYKTETRWHWVTKTREETRVGFRWEGMHLVMYTYTVTVEYQELESYEVQVPYEYKILHVTLTGRSIDDFVRSMGLSDEQLMRYQVLLEYKGNKPEIFK